VISAAALLRDGLDVDDTVPCPTTIEAGGRRFKNFEGGAAGAVPFSRDFAVSCNTAFVSLAPRLAPDALQRTARDYGLGRKLELAVPAAGGRVPPGEDAVERAAAMIGQHEILASPLGMALAAATVADGRWRAPRLVASDPHDAGPALPGSERGTLRSLMRLVVTEGSGTALAGIGGEVRGKSGTAEFGGGDPPPTHAWFIAFRGDVAIAVLVERGRSGGSVAARSPRASSARWTGELRLEVRERAPQRALDGAPHEPAIDCAAQPGPRLELDREPVLEPVAGRREATLVAHGGQPALDAVVLDQPVGVEDAQRHLELDGAAEQPHHDAGAIARLAPARSRLHADEAGPVRRPVTRIDDVVEALAQRDREGPRQLEPHRRRR
jgi:membrane peptidoglycan carboxypeptidase